MLMNNLKLTYCIHVIFLRHNILETFTEADSSAISGIKFLSGYLYCVQIKYGSVNMHQRVL